MNERYLVFETYINDRCMFSLLFLKTHLMIPPMRIIDKIEIVTGANVRNVKNGVKAKLPFILLATLFQ
ncbi:hypothetical protein L3i20_v218430 [Paenibacillus sp. L3-i20]|nr:hypothetical protein L3i20_v218430 [Paenibacillus sp. L3-i20]